MMDKLPKGNLIGKMQAPIQWIFSHTSRFSGTIRISMLDGEGFLLVQKGELVAAYFAHPLKSLSGQSALKYFSGQSVLDFGMWKYGPDEMEAAVALSAELQALLQSDREPRTTGVVESGEEKAGEIPPDKVTEPDTKPEPEPEPETKPKPEPRSKLDSGPEFDRLKAIQEQPGVTAVARFAEGLCISSVGNIDADYVVAFAEDLLRWSHGLPKAVPACGSLIQMTLFYHDGNIIITPYGDDCLCIFTMPGVQFGQIRRLIREILDGE